MTRAVTLILFAAAAATTAGANITVNYDNVDTDRWRCRLCPLPTAAVQSVSLRGGVIHTDEAEPRFGRDNGLDDNGRQADLNAKFARRDTQGRAVTFAGRNLALDSRAARLEVSLPGRYDVGVTWREIPRNVSTDGLTPYSGSTELSLPTGWVPAFDTLDMSGLTAASQTFNDRTKRRQASVDLAYDFSPHWRIEADFENATKRGREDSYGDLFLQSTGLVKPIDYETDALGARLTFKRQWLLISANYRHDRFANRDRSLTWQNPYVGTTATARKGLAPDNESDLAGLMLRAQLGGRTSFDAALTWAEATQNDAFLPYTVNPLIDAPALPATSLNGKVETFSGKFRLVTRPTDRVRLWLIHSSRERDNKTPLLPMTPVLGDLFVAFPASAPRLSRAHSFERSASEAGFELNVTRALNLAVGFDTQRRQRTRLEIAQNDEDRLWTELAGRTAGGLRFKARYESARRDASEFQDLTNNNRLTRRYYMADREQRSWRAEVDYPIDPLHLTVGVTAERRKNAYRESALGLLRDSDRSVGANFAWAPTGGVTVSGFYIAQENDSATAGSLAFAARDWTYRTEDAVDSAGLTVDLPGLISERFDLSASYVLSDGAGDYATDFADMLSAFPELVSKHRAVDVRGRYRINPRFSISARYYYEKYRSEDWAFTDVGQTAVRNVLTLGYLAPNYTVTLVSLSLTASF